MSWLEAIRARVRLLFARGAAESRMEEEIRFHVDMEADRLVREEGLAPREARRRALVRFGGVERTKEEMRSGRGLAWLAGVRLDLKLGARMLVKYPVLTAASVLALAIAVALAASWFEFMTNIVGPDLDFEDAGRIVQVRNRDQAAAANRAPSLNDYGRWRAELETIVELGGAAAIEYGVTTEDGRFETLGGARVTPTLLGITRVRPLLGRSLRDADFDLGAAPVVVLGHGAWQRLFEGDPAAIGGTVRLGSGHATVVGVMPRGFGWPVNAQLWTPLRESALDYGPLEGPGLMMVGRLAPGATLEEAQAELTLVGQRTAEELPATHEHIRPAVNRFGRGSDMAGPAALLNLPFIFFLIVVCANVATLLFARTATRQSEIAMRSALGASRRRIILQLVAEALVLTFLAAGLGLTAAHWGMGWGMDLFWQVQQTTPPFWFDPGLSLPSVLYVSGLAVFAALIIGGIPGLRATGRQLRHRLSQLGAGGAGMRFGAVSTAVIVVQVALCVAFIPVAIMAGRELLPERRESDFPARAYLTGRLVRQVPLAGARAGAEGGGTASDRPAAETAGLFDEVEARLAAEPGVLAATRASRLPGFNHPVEAMEIEGDSAVITDARQVAVDPDFFDVVGATVVAGRPFAANDVTATDGVAIVDGAWAGEAFGGRNPVGRRIRYPTRPGEEGRRWYEVVGVVSGVGRAIGPGEPVAVFHPLRADERASVQLYLRVEGHPAALLPRVQSVALSVHPEVAITELQPLEETWRPVLRANIFFAAALTVVAAVILLFALIGIYALMSFTVTRRAREIGIRAALGADPRRIVGSIFSRAFMQLGFGVVLGATLVSLTAARSPDGLRLVAVVALAVVAVGLVACVLPASRALRIHPIETLRAE